MSGSSSRGVNSSWNNGEQQKKAGAPGWRTKEEDSYLYLLGAGESRTLGKHCRFVSVTENLQMSLRNLSSH